MFDNNIYFLQMAEQRTFLCLQIKQWRMARVILFAGLLLACGDLRRATGAPSVLGKFYFILSSLGCIGPYFLNAQLLKCTAAVTLQCSYHRQCAVSLLEKVPQTVILHWTVAIVKVTWTRFMAKTRVMPPNHFHGTGRIVTETKWEK